MPAQSDLIFDLGCHEGQDAGFYLQKGFRVVGVEANPNLCASLRECFARPLATGQFTLIEKAVAETSGSIEFYANANERQGTGNRQFADQVARSGSPFDIIRVPATTCDFLIGEFGVPHYVKIDIQGDDLICLRQLGRVQERPNFMSIGVTNGRKSRRAVLAEGIKLFKELGYRKFQLIDQSRVPAQQCPQPAQEGRSIAHSFDLGSSGLFGKELPDDWRSGMGVKTAYDKEIISLRIARALGSKRGPWYDLHARL